MLATQFQTHIFSVLVFPKYVRLICWDQSEAVVTNAFFNFDHLIDFFWRYDNSNLKVHSVDETVSTLSPELAKCARKQLAIDESVLLFQFKFATQPDGIFVGYKIARANASPTGQATRIIWDDVKKSVVFMKDIWRINLSRVKMEENIYRLLQEKGISCIPNLICDKNVSVH
jgi:hypothetical protein